MTRVGAQVVVDLVTIGGFVLLSILVTLLLAACPAPPPVAGCAPGSTRCSPDGTNANARPQRCSPERRWFNASDQACSVAGPEVACCLAPNAYAGGSPLHACVPRDRCVAAPEVP